MLWSNLEIYQSYVRIAGVYVHVYVCVCVCVYMSVCLCLCVCVIRAFTCSYWLHNVIL